MDAETRKEFGAAIDEIARYYIAADPADRRVDLELDRRISDIVDRFVVRVKTVKRAIGDRAEELRRTAGDVAHNDRFDPQGPM